MKLDQVIAGIRMRRLEIRMLSASTVNSSSMLNIAADDAAALQDDPNDSNTLAGKFKGIRPAYAYNVPDRIRACGAADGRNGIMYIIHY